jgi:hypothetical protein
MLQKNEISPLFDAAERRTTKSKICRLGKTNVIFEALMKHFSNKSIMLSLIRYGLGNPCKNSPSFTNKTFFLLLFPELIKIRILLFP